MKNLRLLLIMLIVLVSSCKTTKTTYVPIDRIKTEYIVNNDSVYVHDSIYYYIHTKQDTTIIQKYIERTKEVYKTDTLCRIDTIPIILEVEKIVITNELYWWQKGLIWIGFICLLGIIYKIIKTLYIK